MLHPSYRSENSFTVLCTNQSLFITNDKVRGAPCDPGGVCTVTLLLNICLIYTVKNKQEVQNWKNIPNLVHTNLVNVGNNLPGC